MLNLVKFYQADKLFDCMEKNNIKCSVNKSKIITMEVQFLGNTIKFFQIKKEQDVYYKNLNLKH